MCFDFRDLNMASPKDYFPLSHIDMLIDNTVGYAMFSFMDEFLCYNQILTALEGMIKTSFITLQGIFGYAFQIKNARAKYELATTTILYNLIHNVVKVYVDDMIVKGHK